MCTHNLCFEQKNKKKKKKTFLLKFSFLQLKIFYVYCMVVLRTFYFTLVFVIAHSCFFINPVCFYSGVSLPRPGVSTVA